MKSKRFGFLKHYRKIKIEGTNLSNIINKCIRNGIGLRNLRWKNHLESTMEVQGEDFGRFRKMAGHSYKISILKEGGAVPAFRSVKANITTVIGAFLLGALIFYQSTFIAEIRIDGYKAIEETSIRETLQEAGVYEGMKKREDYNDVKKVLYENYEDITWVSVFEKGRMLKVNIAEAGNTDDNSEINTKPANIVASRSGMIEKIIPLKGNATVKKGDYVNKGDILISGKYEYQSSDYSKGDKIFKLYSHAEGQVFAKVPKQMTYYFEKNKREKTPTGKYIPGISIRIGDFKLDTADLFCRYKASVRHEKQLLDTIKPLPIKVDLVKINEVLICETHQDKEKLRKVTEAALRQYAKEKLSKGEKILSSTIEYSESEGLIKANVLLEVLEDIGKEKIIRRERKY